MSHYAQEISRIGIFNTGCKFTLEPQHVVVAALSNPNIMGVNGLSNREIVQSKSRRSMGTVLVRNCVRSAGYPGLDSGNYVTYERMG